MEDLVKWFLIAGQLEAHLRLSLHHTLQNFRSEEGDSCCLFTRLDQFLPFLKKLTRNVHILPRTLLQLIIKHIEYVQVRAKLLNDAFQGGEGAGEHGEPARHRNVVFGSQAHHFVEHLDHIDVADALHFLHPG